MMIVVPAAYQTIKLVLLIIIFFSVLIDLLVKRQLRLHPIIFYGFLFYLILGLLYGIYGFLQGNLGAIPITKEVVVYVFFYMILICGIIDLTALKYIHNIMIFSMFFLVFYLIATFLNAYGIWPNWLYYSLQTETSDETINVVGIISTGRISTSFSSFPGLLFLQPYLFTYIMTQPERKFKWLWILFLLLTIIMIFAGRRILLINAIVFPIIIIIALKRIGNKRNRKKIKWKMKVFYLLLGLFTLVSIVIKKAGIDLQSNIEYFLFTFQSKQITSGGAVQSNVRLETIFHLYQGWLESPIFGFGNGASYSKYLRNIDEPWSYEVLYMQFLYSWGIVGFSLYGLGIYYIYKKIIKVYKENSVYSNFAISSLMGMISFLIGSATNPYLLKFDFLYVIFLPIAIINLYLLKKNRQ